MNRLCALVAGATLMTLSVTASATVVDLFVDPGLGQQVETDGPTVSDQAGNFPDTIVGGFRDLIVSNTEAGGDGDCSGIGDGCSDLTVFEGSLTFNNDTGVDGLGEIQWDGDDAGSVETFDPDGLGGVDFRFQEGCPDTGCEAFSFNVVQADQGFDFVVAVYTDANNFTEFNLLSDGTSGISQLPFDDFENSALCGQTDIATSAGFVNSISCGGGGSDQPVDLSNVGGMFIQLNAGGGTTAVDLEIGGITKVGVPEPGTIALLGAGLAGFGMFGRRRNARKGAAA